MALSYKSRKWLSLLVLIVGLPLYIILAVAIMVALGRPPIWLELLIYMVLGVLWALPLKFVFIGVGQADPDKAQDPGAGRP